MPVIRALAIHACTLAALSVLATAPASTQAKPLVSPQAGPQTMCPEVEMPVCGTKNGTRVRYGNHCKAARDGATDITPGDCPADQRIAPSGPRLRVTKPNVSWSDHYTKLSDLLDESRGDKADVNVRAGRGGALSKNRGVVGVIKSVVRDQEPYLDDARVTGTREGESTETTIRARKHITHSRVAVSTDVNGAVDSSSIFGKMRRFLSSISG